MLKSKRFLPLFITQALGAFNDNVLRFAVSILITYQLTQDSSDAGAKLAIAAGLFIAPFFLFSGIAGQLADKHDKAYLTTRIKLAEIAIMVLGAIALWSESSVMMFAVLFLTGTQSTFFGPIKYGILPQHLAEDELVGGNALIEVGTFLAILCGTLYGGLLINQTGGLAIVSISIISLAIVGWLASQRIPEAVPPDPGLAVDYNIITSTKTILGFATARKNVFQSILGVSWFWFLGFVFLTQIPAFAKNVLNAAEPVTNLFIATFTIGIALGSMLTNRLLKGEVSAKYVPIAAILITVVIIDLWTAATRAGSLANADSLMTISQFLSTGTGWRVLIDLGLIAALGGLFVVPLYAYMQLNSSAESRSRVIASNNIMNAVFMTTASILTLLAIAAGFTIPQIFLIVGIFNAVVAIYICKLLPQELVKYLGRRVFRLLFRVEVIGRDNYQAAGDRAVIVANHTSFLDGPLLGCFLPKRANFAINTFTSNSWWAKPAFALFDLLPIDPTNPMSTRTLVQELQKDRHVVIFPEGRITVTGALMKVYEGPGTIAHMADAPVLPIRIDGAHSTIFSRLRGKQRLQLFPKITITILEPVKFTAPDDMKGADLRRHISQQLYDVMTSMVFRTSKTDQNLFEALLDARKAHGGSTKIIEDINRAPLSFSKAVTGSFVLGRKLAKLTENERNVGVLLPNAAGCFVTLFGLLAYGRVPAMLNFSTGAVNMSAACTAAEVKTIITAHAFIEQGGLEDDIALLSKQAKVIYLEDVRTEIGLADKLLGLAKTMIAPQALKWSGADMKADAPAVILFTSGSEGVPKGVVLSHRNLLSNLKQIAARIDFTSQDIVFNALPMFHAFGLTGGTLLPILSGVYTFFYPSPLHYKIVPELCYDTNATIIFGTDTFLTGYARSAHPYDFYNIRYVVAGAERVKAETREMWMEKFGLRILEGYGATECSPVLAVNTPMQFKTGTVGRMMDGLEHKLEPVDGINEGGKLIVKGPNVMLGYLRADNPGVLEPPPDGWYDTGDIVDIDQLGFVTIKGRAKRFAKIAGEMVSLAAVETKIQSAFKDDDHAVVSVPDPKKGERLVLVTTKAKLARKTLSDALKKDGVVELMVPRTIVEVKEIPVLGSGKVDYVTINKIAREKTET
ncbi:MAG: acyl-[ACP]--phospholipid O-acyltransferase [Rhizobiales bacterium]|nr:acyl-[ACP]--phospholipid O-acyltransferase [Hyphomicrobiales bacterium]